MKNLFAFLICLIFLSFSNLLFSQGPDPYELIAYDIIEAGKEMKKIAVLPYFYKDEKKPTDEGLIIAERVSSRLSLKFEIVKMEQIADAFEKLDIRSSSQIKKEDSIKLGKILNVEGIVLGKLEKDDDGDFKTTTWLIDCSSGVVKIKTDLFLSKDLSSVKPIFTNDFDKIIRKVKKNFGYIEYFLAIGNIKTDIESDPSSFLLLPSSIAKDINNLKTSAFGPLGLRTGGFNGSMGFNLEFSIYKYTTKNQNIIVNSQTIKVPRNYIKTTGIEISGDLLFRTTTKFQLYGGFGLGFSFNKISSDYITEINSSRKIDEFSLGLIWRIPIGLRYIKNSKNYFIEWRYQQNYSDFSRNSSQTNKIKQNLSLLLLGFGKSF